MSSNTSNDPSKNTANDYARWLRGSHPIPLNMTWREVCNKAADKLDELAEYEKLEETKL